MIAKWTFPCQFFFRVDISFNNNICFIRNFKIIGNTFYHIHFPFSNESSQHIFIDIIRQGGSCTVGKYRITSQGNGNRHFLSNCFVLIIMTSTCFMGVPMHTGSIFVKKLHSIHSHIPGIILKIACNNHRKGNKPATIFGPAF